MFTNELNPLPSENETLISEQIVPAENQDGDMAAEDELSLEEDVFIEAEDEDDYSDKEEEQRPHITSLAAATPVFRRYSNLW